MATETQQGKNGPQDLTGSHDSALSVFLVNVLNHPLEKKKSTTQFHTRRKKTG